jgi:hypothetical protein
MSEYSISVPDTDHNSIDYDGDVDTYDVWLWGGSSYDFDVLGDDVDPTLSVVSPLGNELASDDDGGVGTDAHIDFTPGYSGWYTLEVAGYGSDTGSYTLATEYDDGLIA